MSGLHIAIIMDGNGRWATSRGQKRIDGHRVGSEVVRNITVYASKEESIEELTLYAFSTENWKRPKLEVSFLMELLSKYLDNELETYLKNGVRFRAIGDISRFSKKLQNSIKSLEEKTAHLTELTQNLALNYGGRDEVVRAVNRVVKSGSEITEESISSSLDQSRDVDLLIRTGGDHRISNFLLWQLSYAELFFLDKLWPDFNKDDLKEVIDKFHGIDRRFGGLNQ
jgi:undecaprenyl diphosphate synthase